MKGERASVAGAHREKLVQRHCHEDGRVRVCVPHHAPPEVMGHRQARISSGGQVCMPRKRSRPSIETAHVPIVRAGQQEERGHGWAASWCRVTNAGGMLGQEGCSAGRYRGSRWLRQGLLCGGLRIMGLAEGHTARGSKMVPGAERRAGRLVGTAGGI